MLKLLDIATQPDSSFKTAIAQLVTTWWNLCIAYVITKLTFTKTMKLLPISLSKTTQNTS